MKSIENWNKMDTRRLEQLLVLAKTGNLTAAAKLLRITPGGLSKSMDVLESDLGGDALFVRDGRNIHLTDFAKTVVERAPEVVEQVQKLSAKSSAKSDELELRIATFEVFSTYFLSEFLNKYTNELIKISCRELIPGPMEVAVADGVVDVGITYDPIPTQGVDFLRITKCEAGIFGAKDKFKGLTLEELPFAAPVIPLIGTPSRVSGLDGWPDDKIKRTVKYKVDLLETALALCRFGHAVIYAPKFVIELHNQTCAKEFRLFELSTSDFGLKSKLTDNRDIYLIKRRSTIESPLMKKLARAIREICSL